MSIIDTRVALLQAGVLGSENLVMDYEDGGNICRFTIGEDVVRLPPTATVSEIVSSFVVLRSQKGP